MLCYVYKQLNCAEAKKNAPSAPNLPPISMPYTNTKIGWHLAYGTALREAYMKRGPNPCYSPCFCQPGQQYYLTLNNWRRSSEKNREESNCFPSRLRRQKYPGIIIPPATQGTINQLELEANTDLLALTCASESPFVLVCF